MPSLSTSSSPSKSRRGAAVEIKAVLLCHPSKRRADKAGTDGNCCCCASISSHPQSNSNDTIPGMIKFKVQRVPPGQPEMLQSFKFKLFLPARATLYMAVAGRPVGGSIRPRATYTAPIAHNHYRVLSDSQHIVSVWFPDLRKAAFFRDAMHLLRNQTQNGEYGEPTRYECLYPLFKKYIQISSEWHPSIVASN